MKKHVSQFIDDWFRDVQSGDAGVFAGAGLSVPAGFVDWRQLLQPLADEMNLNIANEYDLVAVGSVRNFVCGRA